MKLGNIMLLRFAGIVVIAIGVVNTLQEEGVYLSKIIIGLVLICLSFEKEDKPKETKSPSGQD